MSDFTVEMIVNHNNQIILLMGIFWMLFVGAFVSASNFRNMENLVEQLVAKIEELEKTSTPINPNSVVDVKYLPLSDV